MPPILFKLSSGHSELCIPPSPSEDFDLARNAHFSHFLAGQNYEIKTGWHVRYVNTLLITRSFRDSTGVEERGWVIFLPLFHSLVESELL